MGSSTAGRHQFIALAASCRLMLSCSAPVTPASPPITTYRCTASWKGSGYHDTALHDALFVRHDIVGPPSQERRAPD
jgi:hypothetical protein